MLKEEKDEDTRQCVFTDTIAILEKYTKDVLEFRKLQEMINRLKMYIQEEMEFKKEYKRQYETELKPFLQLEGKLQTVSYLTGKDREKDRIEKIEKEKAKKNKRKKTKKN